MAKVKILIEGYAREKEGAEFVSSTTTLIQEGDLNIIVDPGMNRGLLLEVLRKEGLSLDQINYVVLTHYHLDHSLLAGIFEKAKILDDSDVYSWDGKIEPHEGKIPGTDIEIIKTPGHDMFHCSVLVPTEDFGKVIIAGDIFWWRDSEEQKTDKESLINHRDPYVKNEEALINSRKKVLEFADYIISGHGKMFKVEK
ncbi:MAG: MBL fold metallo-hydrolase [Candidatus Falkowbacteria bacterium]|nr:MBL fold metallo-hydrolase [Candidatus Falkowbacteria bacterium]